MSDDREYSERSLAVLHAIVSDYIASREPVGSKAIAQRHQFGVSSATIRNDMAILEEEELITHTHTSSGRVPTDKGYRLYVDTLRNIRPLSASQKQAIERFLSDSHDIEDLLSRTVRLLAQLTNQVAVVQYPSLRRTIVQHIDLVALGEDRVLCVLILANGVVEQQLAWLPAAQVADAWVHGLRERIAGAIVGAPVEQAVDALDVIAETVSEWAQPSEQDLILAVLKVLKTQLQANRSEKISIAGAANLTQPGEFSGSLTTVLDAIEEQVTLLKLFSELASAERNFAASIGRENAPYGLDDASVIAAGYEPGTPHSSQVGVLGSTRMDYASNIASVRAVASYLNKLLGEDQ